MRRIFLLLAALLLPLMVLAQDAAELSEQVEDDRGFLTGLLERNLSGAGRQVTIDGFAGALSSRATFTRMTIADTEGVWLTLENGAIQWNRSALLRGRIDIAELSADRVLLPRLPGAAEDAPTAEAREFALPELPVGIQVEKLEVRRVEIGAPVFGLEAAISAQGAMSLSGGEGEAQLTIDRLDGPRGEFVLDAGYSNDTRVLRANLRLDEAADGLLVNLLNIHDRPSISAEISGEGEITDFVADISLASDGQPRVTGEVSANGRPGSDGSQGTGFRVDLGGDVAALLPPADRAFFGTQTRLVANGWRGEDGRLEIPELRLETEALTLSGELETNASNAPQRANLVIALGRDAGAAQLPVKLPFGGDETSVESGRLTLQYDSAEGQGWTLDGRVGQLDLGQARIEALTLEGAGDVLLAGSALSEVTGDIDFGATQLAFDDPALAEAVGDAVTGQMRFQFTPGQAAEISQLTLDGEDYGLSGYFLLSGLSGGFLLSADVDARYEDLGRLSSLAGRSVAGRADASVTGYYRLLNRSFDIDAQIRGTDIAVDQPQLDRLLAGDSRISLLARRDETGIELSQFTVDAQGLSAEAQGYLNSLSSDVAARIAMPSLEAADPRYSGDLEAEARLTGAAGQRRLSVSGEANDLRLGIEALDGALQGRTSLAVIAGEAEGGYQIERLELANPQLRADAEGSFARGALDAVANLEVPDLGALRPGWTGELTAQARLGETDGTRRVDLDGTGRNLSLGQPGVDGALTGATTLKLLAEEKDGVITLRDVRLTNDQLNATAEGVYGKGVTDVTAQVDARSLAFLGPGWRGALDLDGSFREAGDGVRRLEVSGTGQDLAFGQAQVDGALAGETRLAVTGTERDGVFTIEDARIDNPRLSATATGKVGAGQTDVSARLSAGDLRFLGNGISGAVTTDARLVETDGTRRITATGSATGLSLSQPRLDPLLRGRTDFDLAATQSPAGLSIQRIDLRNPQVQVDASGDTASGLNVQARLADLALIQPQLPGPVSIDGTVRESGRNFVVDLAARAPGNTDLRISGSAARDFSTTDLSIAGASDAAIANGFVRTRNIEGPLRIDLRLAGPPSLQSLSGRVTLSNGQVADPGLGIRLEQTNVTADLQGGRIALDARTNVAAGGQIVVTGPLDLGAGTADLDVRLDNVVARDPNLYETTINGEVRFTGSLANGPLISGRVDLAETEIRIPSTGLGGAKAIPDINHVGDTRPVRATRAKAGLEEYPSAASRDAGMGGPAATPPANPPRLDLVINAPNRVFVRGRGVDAELGGELRIQGTTRNVIPIGHLSLIRGRVDLLGKRFDLSEGLVELQGSLIPVIRLVASTSQDGITTRIIIDGEARDPEITFESSPELPEEEVLSQLLFGRGLDNISPLQAAQLANALAVLAGRGGEGIVGRLRNQVGLDDLDLQTDDEGNVQVRAGKYLTENLYSDVSVGDNGTTTINLNLDISDSLRARGSVGSDGESTLGVYFERDY
ncbi:translocation/assembly module TamB domain-containing protein [Paracoccus spongiarum]|uniref:Translocation/assembly module TamB domain-containing protein n=1 Tax=Paracoccus spongiarum TaxID=3064387 RepID=A0ABT9JAZ1_9RHOB|nr:translocation/assembly module TamB domain-containing protein [Paracoccus sp. 2205BS29-5]MDP5306983.1 translocation/assembly module TamB domain-containing protein [Paracoccus sp. 2205BS29-5]